MQLYQNVFETSEKIIKQTDKQRQINLLIAVTGSVATIKLINMLEMFPQSFCIRVVMTQSVYSCLLQSEKFIDGEYLHKVCAAKHIEIFRDEDELTTWHKIGDPVLHIQLRKWANCYLIAPLSANTLGKLVHGLCDNLVTLIARCWDIKISQQTIPQFPKPKPIIVCPAMNTLMYTHPITEQQLGILKKWGYHIIDPISKSLACGDVGIGAMANIDDIVQYVTQLMLENDR